jgi:biotin carboxyl carrier protein
MKRLRYTAAAALAASLLLWAGCSRERQASAADAPLKIEPAADPDLFHANKPDQFPLVAAEARRVRESMEVNGVVAADVARTVPVMSLSAGRVVEIHARLGDQVHRDQLLLRIASNDLGSAFADYQKAVSEEALARRALNRVKDLFEHGAAPQKDAEAAEDVEQRAQVDLKTTAERIHILGGRIDQPTSIIDVRAPIAGTIVDQQVQLAGGVKSLDNSPNLFTIADLSEVVPLTVLVIFLVLYSAFDSFKWAGLVLLNVVMAPVGGVAALLITGTHFSVSSGVGFLALFGVSVQIGLIMVEYINQLRARGMPVEEAALDGAVRRLRPIMMTMLVAMLGLLPAALSHGIGSDSQRPFAIVIVGGLIGVLFVCVLLLPTLYVWFASDGDALGEMAMED